MLDNMDRLNHLFALCFCNSVYKKLILSISRDKAIYKFQDKCNMTHAIKRRYLNKKLIYKAYLNNTVFSRQGALHVYRLIMKYLCLHKFNKNFSVTLGDVYFIDV